MTVPVMIELQNKWYNSLCTGLTLDPSTFQLVQASEPLNLRNNDKIWILFDSIPPLSLTQIVQSSRYNSFFDMYSAVVENLMCSGQPSWCSNAQYEVKNYDPPKEIAEFTIDTADILDELSNGESRTFRFDSSTASSDVSHTWARGQIDLGFGFFGLETGGEYDQITEKFASANVYIDASFEKVVSIEARPVRRWFESVALNMAIEHKNIWDPSKLPNWDDVFGDNGTLKRLATQIIVVDGIDVVIDVDMEFSEREQELITAQVDVGVWPFFSFDASGGRFTSKVSFDGSRMRVTMHGDRGNPNVLGVNVMPIESIQ